MSDLNLLINYNRNFKLTHSEIKVSYCRSVMFYPATNECLLNSADSSTSQLESEVDGSEVNYFEFHKIKCRLIEVSKTSLF